MKILLSYIKMRRRAVFAVAIATAVFALVFALYRLPVEAALYAGAIAVFFLCILALDGFLRYRARYREVSCLMQGEIPYQMPEAAGPIEQAYQEAVLRLAEDCRDARAQSERKYRDLAEYYTMWAHQIKLPIAGMRLMLQSGESARGEMAEELLRIEQYVEMVLYYARLGSDSTDYVIRECRLDPIIRQEVKKLRSIFIRRKIRLNYMETDRAVLTDEKWLGFVIGQILSNALKYTQAGEISITVSGDTLSIRDTGIGISPSDLPRVFDYGYTGQNGRTDKRATGIGLSLSRQILGRLGHSISLESEPGRGTCVKIGLDRPDMRFE